MPRGIVLSIHLGCTEFSAAENICRTAQQCSCFRSPSTIITAPCDAPLYHSVQLPLMLTGKADSAQITRRQERSMQVNVSILVAVCSRAAVLWVTFSTADLGNAGNIFLHWSSHIRWWYMFTWCFFTPNHHFYSLPTDLRDLVLHGHMNEWQRRAHFPLAHTLKHTWRLNEDINTRTSAELLWESLHERFTISFE